MQSGRLALAVLLSASLSACVVGPDFSRPLVPQAAKQEFGEAGTPEFAKASLPDQWWRLFEDPVLDGLIVRALQHNTDVRQASANLRRARALVREARAGQFPALTARGAANTNRVGTGANAGLGFAPAQPPEFELYELASDAAYELDLFGGVRRSVEASRADALAAAAELDSVRVSVAAEVARNYALACSNRLQLNVARDAVSNQERTLALVRRLHTLGRVAARDIHAAEGLLAQAEAALPALDAENRAAIHALRTLIGGEPGEDLAEVGKCEVPPEPRSAIPVGDGAGLIARRPDVRAAEARLASDTARIGVATAALYPSIRLAGSLATSGIDPNDLGRSANIGFSLGPLISWSIPVDGVARARVTAASAQADARLAAFDGAVLTALQETEQALARLKATTERSLTLAEAERAAAQSAYLTRIRFSSGKDNALQLLGAEADLLQARQALALAKAAKAEASVGVFRALGGGWEQAPQVVEIDARSKHPSQ